MSVQAICYAPAVHAQSPAEMLAQTCALSGGACTIGSAAAEALSSAAAIVAGSTAGVPGTATTLGTRVQGGPRWSFWLRAGVSRVRYPDELATEVGVGLSELEAGVGAGLFEGFRIMPTVGGFLSVDGYVTAGRMFWPADRGFGGSSGLYRLGARVGLLREGFRVPGISVSLERWFHGENTLSLGGGTDPTQLVFDPGGSNVRVEIGKDVRGVEAIAALLWARNGGSATLVALGPGGPATSDMDLSRVGYSLGGAMTFGVVATVSATLGWFGGGEAWPTDFFSGVHDPTAASFFGSVALRLTL